MQHEARMNRGEIEQEVSGYTAWYHRIQLAPGLVTPGTHPSEEALELLDRVGLPSSCHGLRVLDIGCRDGFFSFALEARGAEVVAIDYAAPDATGFRVAARCLKSSVTYAMDNVYDITPEKYGRFDVILFLGLLYHLRHPMLALDRLRAMASPDALLFCETRLADAKSAKRSNTPLWQFHPRDSLLGDWTNKWAPNMPALVAVIEECLFHAESTLVAYGRGWVRARVSEDTTLGFYRDLDSSTGWWGRSGV
jgi:tRNA (mo5U34)-methyltransferase